LALEYYSKNWLLGNDGVTTREYVGNDADTPILDDYLIQMGLMWRFLEAKGFDHTEKQSQYLRAVERSMSRSGQGRDLNLSGGGGFVHLLDRWNLADTGYGP
jgi:hypothetical protein